MGFGPYSQIVKPAEWVDPLNLDLYAKGTMYKQQLAEKNLQSIVAAHDSLFSIPAFGPDKRKLAELDEQFRQQVAGMDISNLGSLEAMSQIRGLIGQYSTNSDILTIAERGYNWKKMEKEKEAAEKKNKPYMNLGMFQLGKYFQGDEYIQNLKYGNDGYTYDATEMYEAVDKLVTPDKKIITLPNGEYYIEETYDPNKLKKAFEVVSANYPAFGKYVRDMNELYFMENNPEVAAKERYSALITENQNIINKATELKKTAKDAKTISYYESIIKQANDEILNTNKKLENPYIGIAFRQENLGNIKNEQLGNMIEAFQFKAQGKIDMRKSAEISAQLNKEMTMERYKLLLPGTMQYNLTDSEIRELVRNGQVTKNGLPITLNDVSEAAVTFKANQKFQEALQTANARARVKQETIAKLGNKQVPGTTQIDLGGVIQSKSLWDNLINKGSSGNPEWSEADKAGVLGAIKAFPEEFGLREDQVSMLTIDNIKLSKKGGIQLNYGAFTWNVDAGNFANVSTAISKAATETGTAGTSTGTPTGGTSRIPGSGKGTAR